MMTRNLVLRGEFAIFPHRSRSQFMNKNVHHADRVLSLIRDREREHIEFKRRVPSPFKMAKEIAAMANTVGGNILIGVDDDGTVVGVSDEHREKPRIPPPRRSCVTSLLIHR